MGLVGGLIILIMSLTGVLLGFERQTIAAFDGAPRAVRPSPDAARLDIDTLLLRSGAAADPIASVALKAGAGDPVTIRFRDRERAALLLNPYTAEAIAPVTGGKTAAFMSWLRSWHRWLGVTGESRPLARAITGACNAAFLLLMITGLVIWIPRRFSAAAFRTATVFNPRLSGKARDFNWHNSLGLWTAIPLALLVATAMFISYQWPGQYLDKYFGSPSERAAAIKALNPSPSGEPARSTGNSASAQRESPRASDSARMTPTFGVLPLSTMLQTVTSAKPAWQSITITIPPRPDSALQIAVAEGNTYRPDLRHQYYFDAASTQLLRTTNYDSLSTSRKIRSWYRFGHTGEVFGLTGQVLATLASLAGVVLVYTGAALSWRRLTAFIRRRRNRLVD